MPARRCSCVAVSTSGPAGGAPFEHTIWQPDPALAGVGRLFWLLAVVATLWLAARTISRLPNAVARLRWVAIGALTGAIAGLAVGAYAWWLERPRVTLGGNFGLVAVTEDVQRTIGQLGGIASWGVEWLGHDAWLVLAPAVAWGVYGACVSLTAVIASGLVRGQRGAAIGAHSMPADASVSAPSERMSSRGSRAR